MDSSKKSYGDGGESKSRQQVIREIMKDTSLTPQERQKKIQVVMGASTGTTKQRASSAGPKLFQPYQIGSRVAFNKFNSN